MAEGQDFAHLFTSENGFRTIFLKNKSKNRCHQCIHPLDREKVFMDSTKLMPTHFPTPVFRKVHRPEITRNVFPGLIKGQLTNKHCMFVLCTWCFDMCMHCDSINTIKLSDLSITLYSFFNRSEYLESTLLANFRYFIHVTILSYLIFLSIVSITLVSHGPKILNRKLQK